MRKPSEVLVGTILLVLAAAGQAWAALGNVAVTVTTPEREPVVGAKIRIGDEVATTDAQGQAQLTVEEGVRTLEVEHPDNVTTSQPVTVQAGTTTRASVSMRPVFPFMVQNPGGVLGGFAVGPLGLFQDWKLDRKREVETLSLSTSPFVNQSPNKFRTTVKAGGVDAALGLPGFATHGVWMIPAISGVLGGADVKIENTGSDREITGAGWIAGAGFEVAAVPSSLPRSFLAVGWHGWWMNVDDMDFEAEGQDLCSFGFFSLLEDCRNRTDLRSETHEFYLKAGYSFLSNRLTPFGGVKYRWSDLELKSKTTGTFMGQPVRSDLKIDLELGRCDCGVLGLAGLDFRGPDVGELGRVFGRVQTEFNPSGFSVLFKLMFGFGFVDP